MPVEPDSEQLAVLVAEAGEGDGDPVVMLNLNRYRDRDAYARYGEVALEVLQELGGRVLWHAAADSTVIGDHSDVYDDVIAVWYPSTAAFRELVMDPRILAARGDRVAGLERAALIRCAEGTPPLA